MRNTYKPEGSLIKTPENREYIMSEEGLDRAAVSGRILEAPALVCGRDMRLIVDLGGRRGVIERQEAVYDPAGNPVKDIAVITRVGKPVCFKVLGRDVDDDGEYFRLSRRDAQLECYLNFISDLIPGDILDAKVTHLESFGAFVDIGCGITSLMSVDGISVSRISHPRDRLSPGMDIRCVVRSADSGNRRILVSMKELLGTWEENAARFAPGQTVAGVIRSIEEYGIFIELAPNLAGLAELKEGDSRSCRPGQTVAVFIKSIIPERMKIKLVMVDSGGEDAGICPPKYFVPQGKQHIDAWRYSPEGAPKIIESIFEPGD